MATPALNVRADRVLQGGTPINLLAGAAGVPRAPASPWAEVIAPARPFSSALATAPKAANPSPAALSTAVANAPTEATRVVPELQPVQGPHVWYADQYRHTTQDWVYQLSQQDVAELEAAVRAVQARGLTDIKVVSKEEFRLPGLGPKLLRFRDEAVHGRGFVLIRGLPVDMWLVEQVAIAYWGIGLHWGKAVSQNRLHHLLGHVKDIRPEGGLDNPVNRVYATQGAQPYHTDSADLVALLCLRPAAQGGESSWASSHAIYNELLKRNPEAVAELSKPLWVDRKDEVPQGGGPVYQLPVFNHDKGNLIVYYEKSFFLTAARHPGVPELSAAQRAALEAFDELATSDALRLDWVLQPGDIQLLHNHTIVHARTAFTDHEEFSQRRHLMRLWLAPDNDWPLPPEFAERWNGSVEVGNRGGIVVPEYPNPRTPLEAE